MDSMKSTLWYFDYEVPSRTLRISPDLLLPGLWAVKLGFNNSRFNLSYVMLRDQAAVQHIYNKHVI